MSVRADLLKDKHLLAIEWAQSGDLFAMGQLRRGKCFPSGNFSELP
jgi:hypothetical protein